MCRTMESTLHTFSHRCQGPRQTPMNLQIQFPYTPSGDKSQQSLLSSSTQPSLLPCLGKKCSYRRKPNHSSEVCKQAERDRHAGVNRPNSQKAFCEKLKTTTPQSQTKMETAAAMAPSTRGQAPLSLIITHLIISRMLLTRLGRVIRTMNGNHSGHQRVGLNHESIHWSFLQYSTFCSLPSFVLSPQTLNSLHLEAPGLPCLARRLPAQPTMDYLTK